jgi:hypothetical protein
MKDKRFAAEPKLDLGDLDINLGDTPEDTGEDTGTSPEIKDIPVDGESPTTDEGKTDDLFSEPIPDAAESTPDIAAPAVSDNSGEIKKLKEVLKKSFASLQVQLASMQTENSALSIEVAALKNDINVVFEKYGKLKKVFEEHLLFKIPTYEEIDINLTKKDPSYITKAISDALDRKVVKIFKDLPVYNINKFDILRVDDNQNIINGCISVTAVFKDMSKYRFMELDIELWVLDGYLHVPQWFTYQNDIYPFNEDGVRRIDVINNRMDQSQDVGRKTTWVNMQEHNQNKMVVKQNLDSFTNYQSGNSPVYVPNRKM